MLVIYCNIHALLYAGCFKSEPFTLALRILNIKIITSPPSSEDNWLLVLVHDVAL